MFFGLFGEHDGNGNNNTISSFFSISEGTKVVLGLFGISAILFGFGYAMRPVQEIFDDLHDSDNDTEDKFESELNSQHNKILFSS